MRIRDLTWKQLPVWPPEWAMSDAGAGEFGILVGVKIRRNRRPEYIYLEAAKNGHTLWGITMLENPGHLEILYLKLRENLGKPLTEIGDLEIDF
jgi:hypothetical protein